MSLASPATVLDEAMQSKRAVAPTFLASNAHKIGLADEISEDDCAVAGHFDRHVNMRNYTCPTRVDLYGFKVRVFSQLQRM